MSKNPTVEEIVKRRNFVRLTQVKCAELLYINVRAWQAYESGEVKMPLRNWELFCIKTQKLVDDELERIERLKKEREVNQKI